MRPYRNSFDQKNEIEKHIVQILDSGVTRPSTSSFAKLHHQFCWVKRNDTWRFCIDYKKLNSLTMKNKFPIIPLLEEFLDELNGAEYFSEPDLRAMYHQERMKARHIEKTAFKTLLEHFKFKVIPLASEM